MILRVKFKTSRASIPDPSQVFHGAKGFQESGSSSPTEM